MQSRGVKCFQHSGKGVTRRLRRSGVAGPTAPFSTRYLPLILLAMVFQRGRHGTFVTVGVLSYEMRRSWLRELDSLDSLVRRWPMLMDAKLLNPAVVFVLFCSSNKFFFFLANAE